MGKKRSRGKSGTPSVYLRPESKTCVACDGTLKFAWNNDRHVRFIGGPQHIDYHV